MAVPKATLTLTPPIQSAAEFTAHVSNTRLIVASVIAHIFSWDLPPSGAQGFGHQPAVVDPIVGFDSTRG